MIVHFSGLSWHFSDAISDFFPLPFGLPLGRFGTVFGPVLLLVDRPSMRWSLTTNVDVFNCSLNKMLNLVQQKSINLLKFILKNNHYSLYIMIVHFSALSSDFLDVSIDSFFSLPFGTVSGSVLLLVDRVFMRGSLMTNLDVFNCSLIYKMQKFSTTEIN